VDDDRALLAEVIRALKRSSPTACFVMTHWMKPVPSRSVRKWILPLDRRLWSQPRSVTACPSCVAMSSM
jgi:hypothetical protein